MNNNYQVAFYYPDSKQNVCKTHIKHYPIDLNDRKLWFKKKHNDNHGNKSEDPVWFNIKWGGWLTNLEHDQSIYNKNCERQFFDIQRHPNEYIKNINLDRQNYKSL